MGWLDKLRDLFSGGPQQPREDLEGYRRVGEEVFGVEVELANSENSRAKAFLQAAKVFQVMGDALLRNVLPGVGKAEPVPFVTQEQAESWFGRIPDLLVAARQEALIPESAKFQLPIRLSSRVEAVGLCPVSHLAGMRRAADEVESLLRERLEHARLEVEQYKDVLLLYEEARTRRQAGDAIVGSLLNGRTVPPDSHEDAENQYWVTISSYMLIAQGLVYPDVLKSQAREGVQHSKLDSADVWKVTSRYARRDIEQTAELSQAQSELADFWRAHTVTEEEREYEHTVEQLLRQSVIREVGYWFTRPFAPVWRVTEGPVQIVGRVIQEGHVFVWDYGKTGEAGQFVTQSSFLHVQDREYSAESNSQNL
ncbi:hypothetical protein D2Q93_15500 [Alicyclobacillaceae bacterium I2511]|nr:hypothetical protein D2Q93_15500 [Alicyclobacillaceae bacterium I2511]